MDLPGVANSGVTRRLSDLIITDMDGFVTAIRAWLYLRFTLSFRDVEDLVAEYGITVSYETATAI